MATIRLDSAARISSFGLAVLLSLLCVCLPTTWALHSTDTITSGGDNTRTGYQPNHNMNPQIVGSSQFGVMWRKQLLGTYNGWTEQIFAQALVYTPPGDKQYVYVASQMNWIYKLDAKSGDIVASRNLHIPFLVSELDDCNDISFCIGSTATGVIDPDTNTWYLTTKTYRDQTDVEKGRMNGRYYVHAIDVGNLAERPNFPVDLEGLIASNNPIRMFQGGIHHQRPALFQTGPYIYAGFASHCVQYNFTGWVIGWHGQTGEIVEKFATEGGPEDKKGGGIWMSGGGIASDNPNRMFFATGNGYSEQLQEIPVPGRQPPTALEEAVVHMSIGSDGSLSPVDFFIPWEKTQLDAADKDLGTSGIALLDPGVFNGVGVQRIGAITGKSGKLYFLNLDDLGGYQMGPNKKDAVIQTEMLKNSVFATAGQYPLEGGYVYVNVVQHPTIVFKMGRDAAGKPLFTRVAETDETTAYVLGVGHGTSTSLNGQPGTGIYWVTDIQGLQLRAYKAVPENGKMIRILGFDIPGSMKFSRPSFGDGRLYMTTSTGHIVAVGSPVNPPLDCGPTAVEFGNAVVNNTATTVTKSITCKANIALSITKIAPQTGAFWSVVALPAFPKALVKDATVTFSATFLPTTQGPLSDNIQIETTNEVAGYSGTTSVGVRGIGKNLNPVLFITPNTISFSGVIVGEEENGYDETLIFQNQGSSTLTITKVEYSTTSEQGPWTIGTATGPFTLQNVPSNIAAESEVNVVVNFNPTTSGSYPLFIQVASNGGTKKATIVATAGTYPKAKIEFQTSDGVGWVGYDPSTPFSFGNVYQAKTKYLKLRLSNLASNTSGLLGLTVSKPPIGAGKLIAATNQINLGEGTQIQGGKYAEAQIFCSVPRSQPNVDSYIGESVWTMNSNDPSMGKQDIRFVCNAVAEQVGPLLSNGQARYRYVGCYKENNPNRQLQSQLYGSDTNENGMCTSGCRDNKNWIFAGTQYHRECWCGNVVPSLRVNDNDCNFDCSGREAEYCGGNGYFGGGAYISLFADIDRFDGNTTVTSATPSATTTATTGVSTTVSTTAQPTPTGGPFHNPGDSVFGLAGCYSEPPSGRALQALTGDDTLTAAKCWEYCKNYQWAGMEYGRECWCGNTLASGAAKVALSQCSMVCKGNATEYCGAGGRLDLYSKLPPASASPSASPTASFTVADSPSTTTTSRSSISITSSAVVTTADDESRSAAPSESAPSSTASPTPSQSLSPWTYLGCTNETTPRALTGASLSRANMTIDTCQTFCTTQDHLHAGLQYSRECYCGTLASGKVFGATGCTMACGGNSSETCGGLSKLSVYRNERYKPPVLVAVVAEYVAVGCYLEAADHRTLAGGYAFADSQGFTVAGCVGTCRARGFAFAGVEYGQECYCAKALAADAVLADDSRCAMLCKGNKKEYCGGLGAVYVYKQQTVGG